MKVKASLASIGLIFFAASLALAQPPANRRRTAKAWPAGTSDYAKSEYVATEISQRNCAPIRRGEDASLRDCGGVAGYRLLYRGPETKPEIFIATPNGNRFALTYWNLQAGNFVRLSNTAQWGFIRYTDGVDPLVLILEVESKPEEFVRFNGPYTIIVKLTPTEVCPIARVPYGPDSGADGASVISIARSRKCVGPDAVTRKDWLGVVFGLAANGRYDEAKAVIPQMKSSGERVFAYRSIALAQAEAGDMAGARMTLMQGLEKAHLALTGLEDEFTVIDGSVVQHNILTLAYAFARLGLYEDLEATEKLIAPDELADALVTIAKIQGSPAREEGRADLEAARGTLKKAIEIELTRQQHINTRDSHLVNIVRAQADLGFITEARKTIELIKSPSAREVAEQALSSSIKLRGR